MLELVLYDAAENIEDVATLAEKFFFTELEASTIHMLPGEKTFKITIKIEELP